MSGEDLIEKTLVLIKPDAVRRGLIGEIVSRFENAGLRLLAIKMADCTSQILDKHFPIDDLDWIEGMGNRALEGCKENQIDISEITDTYDPLSIGRRILKMNYDYMLSGPVVVMIWQGQHAIAQVRKMVGSTIPASALPGTIRGDYASSSSDYSISIGVA